MRTSKRKAIERYQSAPTVHKSKLPPSLDQIRQRAHEIFLARNGAAGHELDDWLQAERELKAGKNPSPQYKTMLHFIIPSGNCEIEKRIYVFSSERTTLGHEYESTKHRKVHAWR
jgi:hypothetical protein